MDENKLANAYLRTLNKFLDEQLETASDMISQEELWKLVNKLVHMAQPKTSYQDLYNSPESRAERKKLSKHNSNEK